MPSPVEERLRLDVPLVIELVSVHHHGASDEPPGVDAVGRLRGGTKALLDVEVRFDDRHDALSDLVLDGEEVAQLTVIALGPDVLSGSRRR